MHFLLKSDRTHGEALWRRYAGMQVRFEPKDKLRVQEGGICILTPDALFVPLPERIKVIDLDGKPIKSTWKFFVTIESFNPFHVVIDAPSVPLPPVDNPVDTK
jgi:hypothetical protein